MPGNEVEDRIRNQFELENSLQGQHLTQAVDGRWSVHNYDQLVRKQGEVGAPLNFILKNYNLQQIGSLQASGGQSLSIPLTENSKQLIPNPEYSRVPYRKENLINNGFSYGYQGFGTEQNQHRFSAGNAGYDPQNLISGGLPILKPHQDNEYCDSPTLTTNSERSEITEASTDFNLLIGQENFLSRQQVGVTQPFPMQQSGYNDVQLLQQHIMLKQMQDLQRQQHLQQLGDVRQQNNLGSFSAIPRQSAGSQMSPLINGTPVHDALPMFMNMVQRGESPTTTGVSRRGFFSQEQIQALRPMPQQPDASLYGASLSNARGSMNQYSHSQGISNDYANMFAKSGVQTQKPMMQSSGAFLRDQYAVPSDQVYMQQDALMSNQGFQGKDIFGSASIQGFNNGNILGNFQGRNTPQMDAATKDFSERQEQAGWPPMQWKDTQLAPKDLVPLDPIEEKILFNMDDSFSFGKLSEFGAGNFSDALDKSDAFSSLQSGSWSALMQSAVAEASSSDTGLQEEWSGLALQNTEQSKGNHHSKFIDSSKQQSGWADRNLQSASSLSSKPIKDSGMSSSFPGFQQPNNQFSTEQRNNSYQEGSSEQKSPRVTSEWVDRGSQQKHNMQSQQIQTNMHMNDAWAGQLSEHPDDVANQQSTTSCDDFGQQRSKPRGGSNETMYRGRDPEDLLWKDMHSGTDINLVNRENLRHTESKENESVGKMQHQMSNGPHGVSNPFQGGDIFVKQQGSYQRENTSDSCNSQGLNIHDQGHCGQGRIPAEDLHYKSDMNSVGSDGSIIAPQTSQSKPPEAETHASIGQVYNQSFASQVFGLRLAPPSQSTPNSGNFHSLGSTHIAQLTSELQEKHQTWVASQYSIHSFPPTNELLQRGNVASKASMLTGVSSYLNMQGSSVAALESSLPHIRNRSQIPPMPNSPVTSSPSQASPSSTVSRRPPFNLATVQDNCRPMSANPYGQQFPVLEAVSVTQPSLLSGMSRQGEHSAVQNMWINVLPGQQHLSGLQSNRVPSSFPMNLAESGMNLVAGGYGEMQTVKERFMQQTSSRIINSSEQAGFSQGKEISQQHNSDPSALPYDPSASRSIQEGQDSMRHNDNHAYSISDRDLAPSGQFSKMSNLQQNYCLLHQVQGMDGAETDPSTSSFTAQQDSSAYEHDSRVRNPMDNRPSSSGGDAKMLSFFSSGREDPSVKVSSQPVHNIPPHETFRYGQNVSQGQSNINSFMNAHANHAQANLQMAPSWFKQYGSFRNGQLLSASDARNAKPAAGLFSLGKPSQDLQIHASLQQLDAMDPSQVASAQPSADTALVASPHLSASCVLPSDISNQTMNVARLKKRKGLTFEPCSWNKKVVKGPHVHPHISISEEQWALAANRLCEKVKDDAEMLEDIQPMFRPKRRLILTTQLMQQLFHPAPSSILFAEVTSHFDSISYIASRLALGDASSLSYGFRNNSQLPSDNSNLNSEEKLKGSEKASGLKYSEVIEECMNRAKKLENDFQRVEKAGSVLDLRVESQELERFAIINRFAKFHTRGQSDASSSGAQRLLPQRYVMAIPLPKNLPEGSQCLSL